MFQIASFKIICTDSTEIFFSQILLKSFFFKTRVCWFELSLAKTKCFIDPYCAWVSNKHCLLDFFILSKGKFICRPQCLFYPNNSLFAAPLCLSLSKWQCICSPLFLSKWLYLQGPCVFFFIKRPEFGLFFIKMKVYFGPQCLFYPNDSLFEDPLCLSLSKWQCFSKSPVNDSVFAGPLFLLCRNDSVFAGPLCFFYPNASVCTDPLCLSLFKWQCICRAHVSVFIQMTE